MGLAGIHLHLAFGETPRLSLSPPAAAAREIPRVSGAALECWADWQPVGHQHRTDRTEQPCPEHALNPQHLWPREVTSRAAGLEMRGRTEAWALGGSLPLDRTPVSQQDLEGGLHARKCLAWKRLMFVYLSMEMMPALTSPAHGKCCQGKECRGIWEPQDILAQHCLACRFHPPLALSIFD